MRPESAPPEGTIVYLGLGSSLGDRWANLQDALRRLQADIPKTSLRAVSPVYESPHLGLEPGDEKKYPPHLNCVAKIETSLSPDALLVYVQAIEEAGKRQRSVRWGPRTIDIDLLVYGDRSERTDALTLPHPGIASRAFVVLPLFDLAPDLRLPDGRALADLRNSDAIRAQRIERNETHELLL